MKKVFLISSMVGGVMLLVLGVYNFAFKHNPYNAKVDIAPTKQEEKPKEETKKHAAIQAVVDEKVLSPAYNKKENTLRYISIESREVREASLDTPNRKILAPLSGEPVRAVWSPEADKVLVEERNAQETRWYLVNIDAKTETMLKAGMENPVWTQLGDRIVYKYYDAGSGVRTLNIAQPDGSDWKEIGKSLIPAMGSATVPKGLELAFWNVGNAFEETSLKTISLFGGEEKNIFSGKFGADYIFSPNGDKILMSSVNQKGGNIPALGMLSNQGSQYQNLLIPTFTAKAIWSLDNKTVYYALPGLIPESAVIPNDYFKKVFLTQDTFWKVNTVSGEKTRLVDVKEIVQGYDAVNLMLNNDETSLFFVNRSDSKLYQMEL